jgi:hypothetical protein
MVGERVQCACGNVDADKVERLTVCSPDTGGLHVSRSWLYTQPDIRGEILRLRGLGRRAPRTSVPARHRSSDASLMRRLQATTARNRELA